MTPENITPHLKTVSDALADAAQAVCTERCGCSFTKDAEIKEKDVIEFSNKFRTFGLEKFNGPSYISFVNFFKTQQDVDEKKPCGALVLYLEDEAAGGIVKRLVERGFDEEDEEQVMTQCGELTASIAKSFQNKISSSGYGSLIASQAFNYKNNIPEGVPYASEENRFCEINFYIRKAKSMVIDLTMAPPD